MGYISMLRIYNMEKKYLNYEDLRELKLQCLKKRIPYYKMNKVCELAGVSYGYYRTQVPDFEQFGLDKIMDLLEAMDKV